MPVASYERVTAVSIYHRQYAALLLSATCCYICYADADDSHAAMPLMLMPLTRHYTPRASAAMPYAAIFTLMPLPYL